MTINLPNLNGIVDKVLLGFCAFFGWALASWLNGFIPWPG